MKVYFKAYSRTNRDIDDVMANKGLRGSKVNEPILIFGETIVNSEIRLARIYDEVKNNVNIEVIECKQGSFIVDCDPLTAQALKDKYGFRMTEIAGQAIGDNWIPDYEIVKMCGNCQDFGDQVCTTSELEAKHGTGSTPACNEFKIKE